MFLNIHGYFIGAGWRRAQLRGIVKQSRRDDAMAAAQEKRARKDAKRARDAQRAAGGSDARS
jgi:hypothetical protein